jgi:hypothetical protein
MNLLPLYRPRFVLMVGCSLTKLRSLELESVIMVVLGPSSLLESISSWMSNLTWWPWPTTQCSLQRSRLLSFKLSRETTSTSQSLHNFCIRLRTTPRSGFGSNRLQVSKCSRPAQVWTVTMKWTLHSHPRLLLTRLTTPPVPSLSPSNHKKTGPKTIWKSLSSTSITYVKSLHSVTLPPPTRLSVSRTWLSRTVLVTTCHMSTFMTKDTFQWTQAFRLMSLRLAWQPVYLHRAVRLVVKLWPSLVSIWVQTLRITVHRMVRRTRPRLWLWVLKKLRSWPLLKTSSKSWLPTLW